MLQQPLTIPQESHSHGFQQPAHCNAQPGRLEQIKRGFLWPYKRLYCPASLRFCQWLTKENPLEFSQTTFSHYVAQLMREAGKAREKADLCVDEIQVRALACQDERKFATLERFMFGPVYAIFWAVTMTWLSPAEPKFPYGFHMGVFHGISSCGLDAQSQKQHPCQFISRDDHLMII